MSDKLNGVIFSEFLVDNPSQQGTDIDGDGAVNKSDEFIELQNTTGEAISLDGYEVWSDDKGFLYGFGTGATIEPGQTATIIGEYSGTPPAGFYDAGLGEGEDFLRDGEGSKDDTIYLVDTSSGEYIVFSYGKPPPTPSPPPGFPGTSQQGAGESINSSGPNSIAFSRDADGNFVESSSPSPGEAGVACYATGTLIATPSGERPVETLRAGDSVATLDGGPATIRMMLFQKEDFHAPDDPRPIQIKAEALGPNRPRRDLIVSPNHRILVGGRGQLDDIFPAEVFVPAKSLTGLPGVRVMAGKRRMRWVHFLLGDHAVVLANGAHSESMLPGPMVRAHLPPQERRRAVALTARPCLPVRAASEIVGRRPAALRITEKVPAPLRAAGT